MQNENKVVQVERYQCFRAGDFRVCVSFAETFQYSEGVRGVEGEGLDGLGR